MIKFEEHDGMLFRMLEEPVPLTSDTELPCLVRFRMPFSERFMGKHEGMAFFCDAIKKNPLYGNRLYAYETRRVGCIGEPKELEIIGTHVKEGSAEWALYQMRQPKPEPLYKVGDWVEVECQNGTKKWTEQCKVICIYRDDDGYGVNFHGNHQPVTYDGEPFSLHLMGFVRVVRKLSPSEVIVKIGCLSGTVVRSLFYKDTFILITKAGNCFILFDALDKETREIVEGLLKAQIKKEIKDERKS